MIVRVMDEKVADDCDVLGGRLPFLKKEKAFPYVST